MVVMISLLPITDLGNMEMTAEEGPNPTVSASFMTRIRSPWFIGLECLNLQLQAQLPCDMCVGDVHEVGPGPKELEPGKEHLPPVTRLRLDVVEALVGV